MLKEILEDTELGMERSLGALDTAFKKIRTGRATPSLLDSIKVSYYDKLTPLSQVASINIEDAKLSLILKINLIQSLPISPGGSRGIEIIVLFNFFILSL